MMADIRMLVHATDMDIISGHYTMTASIEEHADDGTVVTSPRETFGVSHEEIMQRYSGDPKKWREFVKETLTKRHVLRHSILTELIDWQGKRV